MTRKQSAFAWCLDHEHNFCTDCTPEYTEEEMTNAISKFQSYYEAETEHVDEIDWYSIDEPYCDTCGSWLHETDRIRYNETTFCNFCCPHPDDTGTDFTNRERDEETTPLSHPSPTSSTSHNGKPASRPHISNIIPMAQEQISPIVEKKETVSHTRKTIIRSARAAR